MIPPRSGSQCTQGSPVAAIHRRSPRLERTVPRRLGAAACSLGSRAHRLPRPRPEPIEATPSPDLDRAPSKRTASLAAGARQLRSSHAARAQQRAKWEDRTCPIHGGADKASLDNPSFAPHLRPRGVHPEQPVRRDIETIYIGVDAMFIRRQCPDRGWRGLE